MVERKRKEFINLSLVSEQQQRIISNPKKYSKLERGLALEELTKFVNYVEAGIAKNMLDESDLEILEHIFIGLYHYRSVKKSE